jgi:hypothetical protein
MPITVVNEEKATEAEVAAAKQLETRILDDISGTAVPSDIVHIEVRGDGELHVECNYPGANTKSFTKQIPQQLLEDSQ